MKVVLNVGNLTKILSEKNPIHVTCKGNCFDFIEIKDDKLFFSIPNHKKGGYYRKSISMKHLENAINKTNDDFKELPFKDCRKSFFKAVYKIILTTRK